MDPGSNSMGKCLDLPIPRINKQRAALAGLFAGGWRAQSLIIIVQEGGGKGPFKNSPTIPLVWRLVEASTRKHCPTRSKTRTKSYGDCVFQLQEAHSKPKLLEKQTSLKHWSETPCQHEGQKNISFWSTKSDPGVVNQFGTGPITNSSEMSIGQALFTWLSASFLAMWDRSELDSLPSALMQQNLLRTGSSVDKAERTKPLRTENWTSIHAIQTKHALTVELQG